jgi:hypothetical protein
MREGCATGRSVEDAGACVLSVLFVRLVVFHLLFVQLVFFALDLVRPLLVAPVMLDIFVLVLEDLRQDRTAHLTVLGLVLGMFIVQPVQFCLLSALQVSLEAVWPI